MHLPETAVPVPMRRVAVVALQRAPARRARRRSRTSAASSSPARCRRSSARRSTHCAASSARARREATRICSAKAPDLTTLELQGALARARGRGRACSPRRRRVRDTDPSLRSSAGCPRPTSSEFAPPSAAVGASLVDLAEPRWLDPPTLLRPARAAQRVPPPRRHVRRTRVPRPRSHAVHRDHVRPDVRDDVRRRRARPRADRARALPAPDVVEAADAASARSGRSPPQPGPRQRSSDWPTARRSARRTSCRPLWLAPLDDPTRLLEVAICLGAVLLDRRLRGRNRQPLPGRWRAGRASRRLRHRRVPAAAERRASPGRLAAPRGTRQTAGIVLASVALVPALDRLPAQRGPRRGRQSPRRSVEVLDTVLRVAGNTVSFARLAAFGLVHAAIGGAVLDGAGVLCGRRPGGHARRCRAVRARETSSRSRSRRWSPRSRRCAWSTTSSSPGCSRERAAHSRPGGSP